MARVSNSFLKKITLFSGLDDAEVTQLRQHLHRRSVKDGVILFRQGDPGGELYVVESGGISVVVELPDGQELAIAELKAGEFVGEMSVFEREPRSATCRANGETRLLSMHEEDLFSFIDDNPQGAVKLMRTMISVTQQRLQQTSAFLADMVQWGDAARKRAVTDEFTGLYNRRYLDDALADYVNQAKAKNKPLSIIMCDLDHIHQINDTYSQDVGDQAILAVVGVVRNHLRQRDVAARYGGDEFVFILPDTPGEDACAVGQKICDGVAELDVLKKLPGPIDQVTTTLGVATIPDHALEPQALRDAADAALYKAKESGRNRVAVAEREQTP